MYSFFITNYEGIHAALLKYYLLKLIKGNVRRSSQRAGDQTIKALHYKAIPKNFKIILRPNSVLYTNLHPPNIHPLEVYTS